MKYLFSTLSIAWCLWVNAQSGGSETYTSDSSSLYHLRNFEVNDLDDMPMLTQLPTDHSMIIDLLQMPDKLVFEDSKQDHQAMWVGDLGFLQKEKPKTSLNIFTPPYQEAKD